VRMINRLLTDNHYDVPRGSIQREVWAH
jgi:hypothetical protein